MKEVGDPEIPRTVPQTKAHSGEKSNKTTQWKKVKQMHTVEKIQTKAHSGEKSRGFTWGRGNFLLCLSDVVVAFSKMTLKAA